MVASVQPLATDAGVAAFERGGNAVDAALATALTLGVVDNHNSGLGGGCFIFIRCPDGSLHAIDGREKAPAAATRDMYVRDGKVVPDLSTKGALAVGVPGALAAYELALQKSGRLKLEDLLMPAAKIAEEGFPIDEVYARKLKAKAEDLREFPGSSVLLKADGSPYLQGEVLRQHDLALSYRNIAEQGTDWFYRGPYAKQVGDWMAENGGILTAQDFADYQPVVRRPLVTSYKEWQVIGFPPPSSGGVHVAQILNMLESFSLRELRVDDPVQGTHLVLESMKLAFADRAYWLGDADFADVPKGLISQAYADSLVKKIDPNQAVEVSSYGTPPNSTTDLFSKHTTHIATADTDGYWVAITATVNTTFGSKVIVPGTGIVLNNEMDDFSSQPGTPNAFGLLGAENNSIAPGKRPLSSMSPTIVCDAKGEPVMTVGAAGGPKIITQVVQTILGHLEYRMPLSEAIAAPRVHHQWFPNSVLVEEAVSPTLVEGLENRGHKVTTIASSGVTQAIARDSEGSLKGVHDPRVPGKVGQGIRQQDKN